MLTDENQAAKQKWIPTVEKMDRDAQVALMLAMDRDIGEIGQECECDLRVIKRIRKDREKEIERMRMNLPERMRVKCLAKAMDILDGLSHTDRRHMVTASKAVKSLCEAARELASGRADGGRGAEDEEAERGNEGDLQSALHELEKVQGDTKESEEAEEPEEEEGG